MGRRDRKSGREQKQMKRVERLGPAVLEAVAVPEGRKRKEWVATVARKHGLSPRHLYRLVKRCKDPESSTLNLKALIHSKRTRGALKAWSPEAADWWIGLVLKKEHRRQSSKALYYGELQREARARGWSIGTYESALRLVREIPPQFLAIQKGGARGLDQVLPPILRDYSDLSAFELLVGDQHRFDFWVCDEKTGELFRPEGYLWQDLKTRVIYGIALGKHYDAYLMGLALRLGLEKFGPFKGVYLDHGKPEESHYVEDLLREIRLIGAIVNETIDCPVNTSPFEEEDNSISLILPGTHKRAIVRNAKAKLIERTNQEIERILRDVQRIPGHTKRLTDSQEQQEMDEKEVQRLAKSGKLHTFTEFTGAVLQAVEHYNNKDHSGVVRESRGRAKTPLGYLELCREDGSWQPVRLHKDLLEYIFLPRTSRKVNRGTIQFQREIYEAEELLRLEGQRVDLRFDPFDPSWLAVFRAGEYVCVAELMERGSMKNKELTARKIAEKRRRRTELMEQYQSLTSSVPDLINYSQVPVYERAPALIARDRARKAQEREELYGERTPEQMQAELSEAEKRAKAEAKCRAEAKAPKLPPRPDYFLTQERRFQWCLDYLRAGGDLLEKDREFFDDYLAKMEEKDREDVLLGLAFESSRRQYEAAEA
jgi:putative transposase